MSSAGVRASSSCEGGGVTWGRLARTGSRGRLDSQPADYPASIADEWRRIINRLRADSMDALDLLRCLSFFGSEPIPRESLYRGRYFHEISISPVLSDSIRANRAILMLQRACLL